MNLHGMKIPTRLTLGFVVLVTLVTLVSLMAGFGLHRVKSTNESIGTIYADRVVPLKQLKIVSDMYAVGIVDATNKVTAGIMEPKAAAKEVGDSLSTAISTLIDVQLKEAKAEYDRSTDNYQRTPILFSVVVFLSVVLASVIGWMLIKAITVPLNQVVDIARSVASGNPPRYKLMEPAKAKPAWPLRL